MPIQHPRLTFDPGATLVEAGAPVETLYLIREGAVSMQAPTGGPTAVFGPGSILGLADIIEGAVGPKFAASATALEAVVVEPLDAVEVDRQIQALSPRLRACLVALKRSAIRVLEANQHTDARVSRVVAKAKRGLDEILDDGEAETESWAGPRNILDPGGLGR